MYDVELTQAGDLPERTTHIEGPLLTRQRLQARLRTFKGEWFLDTRRGLPYFDWKQQKDLDLSVVQSVLRRLIATTPGVLSVQNLDVAFANGRIKASASLRVADEDRAVAAEITGLPGGNSQPVAVLFI